MVAVLAVQYLYCSAAETYVTVPGIRFVVDPGYVKQKCYDPSR